MKKAVPILLLLAAVGAAVYYGWFVKRSESNSRELVLHGNVDLRQVSLAFNNSERIAAVLVQEGDHVKRGDVLAKLETSRLEPQVAQSEAQVLMSEAQVLAQKATVEKLRNGSRKEEIAQAKAMVDAQRAMVDKLRNGNRSEDIAQSKAQVEAQKHATERLHNGSRPEEIAQAKANVAMATADANNARIQHERLQGLLKNSAGKAVSQQDADNAKTALDMAEAKLAVSQKALDLATAGPRKEDVGEGDAKLKMSEAMLQEMLAGPRKEDIAEAEARLANFQAALDLVAAGPRKEDIAEAEAKLKADEAKLKADQAQLTYLKRILADSQLVAPLDAIVRTRVLEPGEMVTPQKTVFNLAIVDPKWVRAYVSEPDMGSIRQGMTATVGVDSFPGKRFEGWVGFISPVAEFTPKDVQTEELRTSLVYEVRVFVKDPGDELRLGMPATVYLTREPRSTQPPATTAAPSPVSDRAEKQ